MWRYVLNFVLMVVAGGLVGSTCFGSMAGSDGFAIGFGVLLFVWPPILAWTLLSSTRFRSRWRHIAYAALSVPAPSLFVGLALLNPNAPDGADGYMLIFAQLLVASEFGAYLVGLLLRPVLMRPRRPRDPGVCHQCGYILAGLSPCPECGSTNTDSVIERPGSDEGMLVVTRKRP